MEFERYTVDLNAKCVCGCMEGDRIHKIYRFPNDYGASVVSAPKADLAARGTFRLYILHFETPAPEHEYEIARGTELTDDHIVCRDWSDAERWLQRVFELAPESGEHHHHCH
jgi:dihydroorotase-like cyclic amidohydrolase